MFLLQLQKQPPPKCLNFSNRFHSYATNVCACCGPDAAPRALAGRQKHEANQGARNQRLLAFQKQPLNLFSMWCTLCSLARNAAGDLIQFHRKKKKKRKENGFHLTPCLCQFLVCAWDINPAGAHRLPYLKQDGNSLEILYNLVITSQHPPLPHPSTAPTPPT